MIDEYAHAKRAEAPAVHSGPATYNKVLNNVV